MTSPNLKRMLFAVGFVSAFGCGDSSEDPAPQQQVDAGARPTGMDAGAQCVMTAQGSGVACNLNGQPGFQLCSNGVPTGACITINGLLDSGIFSGRDGGPVFAFDASALFDGSLPDGALNSLPACKAPLTCGGGGGLAAGLIEAAAAAALPGVTGASYCAPNDGIGLPAACTTAADCASAYNGATCLDTGAVGKYCAQFCKK